MRNTNTFLILVLVMLAALVSCDSVITSQGGKKEVEQEENKKKMKIVSLSGTITETLAQWGMKNDIVGVDVTSTYPEDLEAPVLGHISSIGAEAVISLKPTHVFAIDGQLNSGIVEKLNATGVEVITIPLDNSLSGVKAFYENLGEELGKEEESAKVVASIEEAVEKVEPTGARVLFVYARSAGNMMVAGEDNSMDAMIRLAGGENVATELEGYKPFTQEALVKYNPDVVLFFESGLESIGGLEGALEVPGMMETKAGKNRAIYGMDGHYLAGMGPRMGKALLELNELFKKKNEI